MIIISIFSEIGIFSSLSDNWKMVIFENKSFRSQKSALWAAEYVKYIKAFIILYDIQSCANLWDPQLMGLFSDFFQHPTYRTYEISWQKTGIMIIFRSVSFQKPLYPHIFLFEFSWGWIYILLKHVQTFKMGKFVLR